MNITLAPKTVARRIGIIVLFLALAHLLASFLDIYTGRTYGLSLFDLERERNITAFFGAVLLLLNTLLLGFITIGYRQKNGSYFYWAGLTFFFLFLALDKATAINEYLINPAYTALNTFGLLYYAIILIGLLFMVLVGFYTRFLWQLPPKTRLFLIIGGGVFVLGGLVFELIGTYYWYLLGPKSTPYILLTMFEEVLEMVGTTIFIYTLLDYIGQTFPKIQIAIQFSATSAEVKTTTDSKILFTASEKQ
jgi:hypothetical protein